MATTFLTRFLKARPATDAGRALFAAAHLQARTPDLYARLGAPDTVDGRFEMLLMHVVLVIARLRAGPLRASDQAAETRQALFDAFVANLDDGLREMGVGDLSMGKKMRKLGEAIYGRAKAYDPALAARPDLAPLASLIGRTVFGDEADGRGAPLAAYADRVVRALEGQADADLLGGRVAFPAGAA